MKIDNPVLRQIWEDRYSKNNEDIKGNLHRVAKHCSTSKEEEERFYNVMNEGLFFPAGRTMSNSGIGRDLTLNNCFMAGSKVITKRGLINIEDIIVGDKVITHLGTWERVNNVMSRDYEGDMYKISSISAHGDICCTPNHEFLTQNGWVRADRLLYESIRVNPVDRLKVPSMIYKKEYQKVDLLNIIKNNDKQRVAEMLDNKIALEKKCNKNRHNDNVNWMRVSNPVNRYLEFTPEFRYLIGRWIGDGSITRYRGKKNPSIIQIVFNATKEKDDAIKCKEIGDKIFGISGTYLETKQNVIAIRWSSEILGTWFLNEFGEKCDKKYLKEKYTGDLEIAKGLFDADGFIDTHGGGRLILKNHQLISWFRETMYLNGYNTSQIKEVKKYKDTYAVSYATNMGNKGFNQQLCKSFHDKKYNKITENTLYKDYVCIDDIEIMENVSCKVYNISVENAHSYTVNGVLVHNCFTSPLIKDDLTDIFEKVLLGAKTHQKGGGIGYNFSQLRPKGSPTSNDAIASGAISFMDVFNAQTDTILQGSRRGANMGLMSVYSIDIEDFVNAKAYDANKLNHFNVTVMIDDDFMNAKNNDEDIWLHYPVYDENGFILKDETKWKYKKTISAKYLWDLIIQRAYENGEPGIAYCDTMNKDNNLWYIENIVATNPCFEYLSGTVYGKNPITGQKLNSDEYGGACNLGSLMLHNFVSNPFTTRATVDYDKLKETIHTAINFLDNIIDINKFPDVIYENYQNAFRTIGLGITGFADMLAMLGLKYGSKESQLFTFDLMNFITLNAYRASIELAKEKGEFPFIDREKFVKSGFLQKHAARYEDWECIIEDIKRYGIRNSKMISIAPTGTMSLTFGNNCSSGLEPIFSLEYDRKVKIGGQSDDDIQIVKMQDYGYKLWQETTKDNIVGEDIFVTALNLSVQEHLDMLRQIAYHVDMSSSKTINLPTDYSFEDTKKVYDYCWKAGIKGCTIFRPNEIRQGILIDGSESAKKTELPNAPELGRGFILNVNDDVIGKKRKLISGCGSLHCVALFDPDNGDLLETYLSKGSTGGCTNFMVGLSRMISLAARGGIGIYEIIDQLNSTGVCPSYAVRTVTKKDTSKGSCCPVAIGNALLEMYKEVLYELGIEEREIKEVKEEKVKNPIQNISNTLCPECNEPLINEGGCIQCKSCGWSKCN